MSERDEGYVIVVATYGFVFVGRLVEHDSKELVLQPAANVRQYGTTKGMPELAAGPTPNTKVALYANGQALRINSAHVHHIIDTTGWTELLK